MPSLNIWDCPLNPTFDTWYTCTKVAFWVQWHRVGSVTTSEMMFGSNMVKLKKKIHCLLEDFWVVCFLLNVLYLTSLSYIDFVPYVHLEKTIYF